MPGIIQYQKAGKIGRRKAVAFFVVEKPELKDRGCDTAIEVYELNKRNYSLKLIGARYDLQIGSWKGWSGVAVEIIGALYSDFTHDGYHSTDDRVLRVDRL